MEVIESFCVLDTIPELATQSDHPVPSALPASVNENNSHVLHKIPDKKERECFVCRSKNVRSRSRSWCPGCDVGVHPKCFADLQHFLHKPRRGRKRAAVDDVEQ